MSSRWYAFSDKLGALAAREVRQRADEVNARFHPSGIEEQTEHLLEECAEWLFQRFLADEEESE